MAEDEQQQNAEFYTYWLNSISAALGRKGRKKLERRLKAFQQAKGSWTEGFKRQAEEALKNNFMSSESSDSESERPVFKGTPREVSEELSDRKLPEGAPKWAISKRYGRSTPDTEIGEDSQEDTHCTQFLFDPDTCQADSSSDIDNTPDLFPSSPNDKVKPVPIGHVLIKGHCIRRNNHVQTAEPDTVVTVTAEVKKRAAGNHFTPSGASRSCLAFIDFSKVARK
ncbi:hypothetical protein Bbelb_019290 [Branchiostoma belcheri]|nr:hypothetical protein Bbelb_019290 [Branchiostoma belcheri]